MSDISILAPAKLNLFLAVTGRRADGFHDLVSVAAPLDFGDTLRVEPADEFSLTCDDPAVPLDGSNLVLKAASAFATATADTRGFAGAKFFLEKRIPLGAGLGGGSSDAAAALVALNTLAGNPLDRAALVCIAGTLGSDCALFLSGGPVVMHGRGERVEALPARAAVRLRGRRVLVFKPGFPISTAWAYAEMAGSPAGYVRPADAVATLEAWLADDDAVAEKLLGNNLERVAFAKFVALPVLLETLRAKFGLAPRMSGSGSACFAFLAEGAEVAAIAAAVRTAWGESAFVREARLQ